ncbi:NfeD family protein [Lutispora thermophila]|uniref:NfeD family protein n=1 Tax=Lutispora thermophila TaxID=288966 RepID=UPI000932365F|nr:NfeD family protein [Lutispora thermophila]
MLGDWNILTIVLYVFGLLLLTVEGLMPGFGVAGITGTICVVISIALITSSLYEAILLVIATIAVFVTILVVLYKLGYGSKYLKFIILDDEQKKESGYTSSKKELSYIGKIGVADTPLRPSGVAIIEGERVNVQSQGDFIQKGSRIIVTEVDGMKIIVKKCEEEI